MNGTRSTLAPGLKWGIATLMGVTMFRTQTVLFLPEVAMFGGPASDVWFVPWLSDALLGMLVPLAVYLFWTRRGVRSWGALVAYNAIGAFDYVNGLGAQAIAPMPEDMASAATVYGGISVFLVAQLTTLGLLLRTDVIHHFAGPPILADVGGKR